MLAKFLLMMIAVGTLACGASSRKGPSENARHQGEVIRSERVQQKVQESNTSSTTPAETAPAAPVTDQPENQQPSGGVSQEKPPHIVESTIQNSRQTMDQGIVGKVVLRQGNRMPSPDAPQQSSGRGVKRELHIHELTDMGQVTGEPPFYQQIQTKRITKVVSDENGNFAVELKPGRYSVFAKEKEGFYANLFDGQNNIFPVEVKENQVTAIEFIIDYNATY